MIKMADLLWAAANNTLVERSGMSRGNVQQNNIITSFFFFFFFFFFPHLRTCAFWKSVSKRRCRQAVKNQNQPSTALSDEYRFLYDLFINGNKVGSRAINPSVICAKCTAVKSTNKPQVRRQHE